VTPNASASRWYAYNVRTDLLKPKVTVHDAQVKRFEALFTAPPVPGFIPHKSACNVALRQAQTDPFRVGQVRRDLGTITAEMNRPWTPRLYRPTLRDHRT
jgi:hypothetical protein